MLTFLSIYSLSEVTDQLPFKMTVLFAFQAGWEKNRHAFTMGGIKTDPLMFYNKQSSWIAWQGELAGNSEHVFQFQTLFFLF